MSEHIQKNAGGAYLLPALTGIAAAAVMAAMLLMGPAERIAPRVPRASDESAKPPSAETPELPPGALDANALGGQRATGPGQPAELTGHWPEFRGVGRDAIAQASPPLRRDWGPDALPVLWQRTVGEGHAGTAVANGRVYLLDYDRDNQRDVLRCMSLADGQDIWTYSYPVAVKRNHGMSRTVPAVADGYVVSLGPKCHVVCADANTGQPVWTMNLPAQYGTVVPQWYAGQCPRIDDGAAILAPAGPEALLVAIDCASGQTRWTTPNAMNWDMTHSSIVRMTAAGQEMYVYCGSGGVAGVDPETGELLWTTAEWKIHTTVPTPVPLGDGRLLCAGGYNAGAVILEIARAGAGGTGLPFDAKVVEKFSPRVFGSDQQTPILYENHVYAVRPGGELTCMTPDGKILWTSGRANVYGIGPYLIADGVLLVMNDSGRLTLVAAEPEGFTRLAEKAVLDGHDSWAPMALAGGRLLLRDLTTLMCIDLRAEP